MISNDRFENCERWSVEDVLESDSVVPVLERNFVSSHMGPGTDRSTERETESEKQTGGRLHLGEKRCSTLGRGWEKFSAELPQLEWTI